MAQSIQFFVGLPPHPGPWSYKLCKDYRIAQNFFFPFRDGEGKKSQEVIPQLLQQVLASRPWFPVKLVDNKLNCDSALYMDAWKRLIRSEFCQFLCYVGLYSFCWQVLPSALHQRSCSSLHVYFDSQCWLPVLYSLGFLLSLLFLCVCVYGYIPSFASENEKGQLQIW